MKLLNPLIAIACVLLKELNVWCCTVLVFDVLGKLISGRLRSAPHVFDVSGICALLDSAMNLLVV